MKITFVLGVANLTGGVRIVAEHARMLHERGHTVTVAASRRADPGLWVGLRRRLRGKRTPKRISATHLDGAAYRVVTTESPRPVVASDVPDADIIVATWWETAEWVQGMPASKGVKVNFLQGYDAQPSQPQERVDAVWRLPMRKIVVSSWLHRIASQRFDDQTAILVPNGLDAGHFNFCERSLSGSRVVGTVSTLKRCKRFRLAAEVIKRLNSRGGRCAFVGFGADVGPQPWIPAGSRFEVTPSQMRIAEIYQSCDCWLFTSDQEGYGLPILEAMACGTPVVATPAGAAPELLASGGGILVDSDDPEVLADAVERVLSMDEASWRAMSRAARAEAEKHSWDVIGDRMEAALKQILEEWRSA